jgi:drug/metabolite transporter (DMT)-like permease
MSGGTGLVAVRIAGLFVVALLLGCGQLLFKLAADRLVIGQGFGRLAASFLTAPMAGALVLYGLTTVLWVYLLHGFALSRAYPFIALAFAIVPLLGWLLLDEALAPQYWIGLAIMLAGLYVVTSSA